MHLIIGFAIVFLACYAAFCIDAWSHDRVHKKDNAKRAVQALVVASALLATAFLVRYLKGLL
jgi:hypothetical protein